MQNEPNFTQLVKKAQKRSTLRTVVIAFLVTLGTLLLIYGLLVLGQWNMYKKMDEKATETMNTYSILGANLSAQSASYDHFFVAGTTKVQITKQIGDTLLPWQTVETFHTILGTESVIQPGGTLVVDEDRLEVNGHQELSFQVAGTTSTIDDRERLTELPDYMRVELALSFNKMITPEEALQAFPDTTWFWVPTANSEQSVVPGSEAFGFSATSKENLESAVDAFEQQLKAEGLELETDDVMVSGVVISGTLGELRSYLTKPEIIAVRNGVIIPY